MKMQQGLFQVLLAVLLSLEGCWGAVQVPALPISGKPKVRPPANKLKLIGYYSATANYREPVPYLHTDIPVDKLTHIIYAFMDVHKTNHQLVSGDEWTDFFRPLDYMKPWQCDCCAFGNFAQVFHLKKRNPQLQVLISIGGWTYSYWISDAVRTPERREVFATSIVRWVTAYGFDGIDMDWVHNNLRRNPTH